MLVEINCYTFKTKYLDRVIPDNYILEDIKIVEKTIINTNYIKCIKPIKNSELFTIYLDHATYHMHFIDKKCYKKLLKSETK